jgi:hypothetical protein
MNFSNLHAGYVCLKYISPVLDPISDEYVVHISTRAIGRLCSGRFAGDAVDVCAPFQLSPGGEFFFEFDTDAGKMVIYASAVFTLISECLGDAPMTDEVQAQVEQPADEPTPSKGWLIGRLLDGEIDTVSIVYSDECDVDQEIVNFATHRPDTTYMKMEIKAYVKACVKAKVEAVWS